MSVTDEDLLLDWPEAPADERPKSLFVNSVTSASVQSGLLSRGWKVIDVRTLANRTDGDRAEALKANLEGIRQGTIGADKDKLRWLELEAKVYGLLTGKDKIKDDKPKISEDVLDDLLNFKKTKKNSRRGK